MSQARQAYYPGLGLVLFGGLFAGFSIHERQRAVAAASWPGREARITSCELRSSVGAGLWLLARAGRRGAD